MKEFTVRIRSFQQIQDFVALASVQPFRILVFTGRELVNAKSFIGMASLDYSFPVKVRCDCPQEEFEKFRLAATRFRPEA